MFTVLVAYEVPAMCVNSFSWITVILESRFFIVLKTSKYFMYHMSKYCKLFFFMYNCNDLMSSYISENRLTEEHCLKFVQNELERSLKEFPQYIRIWRFSQSDRPHIFIARHDKQYPFVTVTTYRQGFTCQIQEIINANRQKHENHWVSKTTCSTCNEAYLGQMNIIWLTSQVQQHKQNLKGDNRNSKN